MLYKSEFHHLIVVLSNFHVNVDYPLADASYLQTIDPFGQISLPLSLSLYLLSSSDLPSTPLLPSPRPFPSISPLPTHSVTVSFHRRSTGIPSSLTLLSPWSHAISGSAWYWVPGNRNQNPLTTDRQPVISPRGRDRHPSHPFPLPVTVFVRVSSSQVED